MNSPVQWSQRRLWRLLAEDDLVDWGNTDHPKETDPPVHPVSPITGDISPPSVNVAIVLDAQEEAAYQSVKERMVLALVKLYGSAWSLAVRVRQQKISNLQAVTQELHTALGVLTHAMEQTAHQDIEPDSPTHEALSHDPLARVFKNAMGDGSLLAKHLQAKINGALLPEPTDYLECLQTYSLIVSRIAVLLQTPNQDPTKTQALKTKVVSITSHLFADLHRLLVTGGVSNSIRRWFGETLYLALKSTSAMYGFTVLADQLPAKDTQDYKTFQRAKNLFSQAVGNAQVYSAYRFLIPKPLADPEGKLPANQPITQSDVKLRLLKRMQAFFQRNDMRSTAISSGLAGEEEWKNLTRLVQSEALLKASFYGESFIQLRTRYTQLLNQLHEKISHVVEVLKEKQQDTTKPQMALDLLESYLQTQSKYGVLIGKIYRESLLRLVRSDVFDEHGQEDLNRCYRSYNYHSHRQPNGVLVPGIYSRLRQMGVLDIPGPLPANANMVIPRGKTVGFGSDKQSNVETGFFGEIDQFGNLYTKSFTHQGKVVGGLLLANPMGSPAIKVRMNSKYDYAEDDGYVFETTMPNGVTGRRYTHRFTAQGKVTKFGHVTQAIRQGANFRDHWLKGLYRFFHLPPGIKPSPQQPINMAKLLDHSSNYKEVWKETTFSLVAELIYLTSMRVGTEGRSSSRGQPTYGAVLLERRHLAFSLGKNSNNKYEVLGVTISYNGKGNRASGGVPHKHELHVGLPQAVTDTASKRSVTQVSDLEITHPAIHGDPALPVFLYLLYITWGFVLDWTHAPVRQWKLKTSPTDKVFHFNWRGRYGLALVDDKGLGRYFQALGLNGVTAHTLRRLKGTAICQGVLFDAPQAALNLAATKKTPARSLVVQNPLRNLQDFNTNPVTQKERTLAEKVKLANDYCDAAVETVASELGHMTMNSKTQSWAINRATSRGSYINPVVFQKYFTALGFKTPPLWVQKLLKKVTED